MIAHRRRTLHDAYKKKDAAWIANIGGLVEPMSKEQFVAKTRRRPPSLFAHNMMQRAAANVHAQYGAAKGVLGRICDSLRAQKTKYKTALYRSALPLVSCLPPVIPSAKRWPAATPIVYRFCPP